MIKSFELNVVSTKHSKEAFHKFVKKMFLAETATNRSLIPEMREVITNIYDADRNGVLRKSETRTSHIIQVGSTTGGYTLTITNDKFQQTLTFKFKLLDYYYASKLEWTQKIIAKLTELEKKAGISICHIDFDDNHFGSAFSDRYDQNRGIPLKQFREMVESVINCADQLKEIVQKEDSSPLSFSILAIALPEVGKIVSQMAMKKD